VSRRSLVALGRHLRFCRHYRARMRLAGRMRADTGSLDGAKPIWRTGRRTQIQVAVKITRCRHECAGHALNVGRSSRKVRSRQSANQASASRISLLARRAKQLIDINLLVSRQLGASAGAS
jgi:hypothetical protein